MGIFQAIHETSEKAINSGEHYIHASRSYYKLKTFKYITKSLSLLIVTLVLGSLVGIALIFLLVAMTIWLSQILNSLILACLITSSILLTTAVLIFLCRKHIDRVIIQKVGEDYFNS